MYHILTGKPNLTYEALTLFTRASLCRLVVRLPVRRRHQRHSRHRLRRRRHPDRDALLDDVQASGVGLRRLRAVRRGLHLTDLHCPGGPGGPG